MTQNRIQTGKGDKLRKGANMKAYWNADIWNKMGPKSIKTEKSVLKYSVPVEHLKSSLSSAPVCGPAVQAI